MASTNDGTPVGRSFEVYAADEPSAIHSAYGSAKADGMLTGKVLFTEQIEVGKWEIAIEEITPETLLATIDEWFEQARTNADPEHRHLGGIALLGQARDMLRKVTLEVEEPRSRAAVADDLIECALAYMQQGLDTSPDQQITILKASFESYAAEPTNTRLSFGFAPDGTSITISRTRVAKAGVN